MKAWMSTMSNDECQKISVCHWQEDEDAVWRRTCDKGNWVCYEGTPKDNSMNYCPACGAYLIEHKYVEQEATND